MASLTVPQAFDHLIRGFELTEREQTALPANIE